MILDDVYIQSYMGCSSTNIIIIESVVIECFSPLIHEPSHSGWINSGDQSVCVGWCFQLYSSRLSHNQLDARSTAWLSFWIAFRLSLPVVPTAVISRHMDYEQNPLTHTSMGNSQLRHPRCLQGPQARCTLLSFSHMYLHILSHQIISM